MAFLFNVRKKAEPNVGTSTYSAIPFSGRKYLNSAGKNPGKLPTNR
jgi:hypothetical protein